MAYFEVSEADARALRLAWATATARTPGVVAAHQEGALASSLGWPASAAAWRELAAARNEEAATWA